MRFADREALRAVSAHVWQGELVALLGPNGSGKTTLFRILATLLRPSSGSASIQGYDVLSASDAVRRHIGVVFQKPSLDQHLTIRENMRCQGHLYGMHGTVLERRIDEQLDRFGLVARSSDRVQDLSGGLQRRVELAKVLLHKPEVMLLDEPSTGLDPVARADLMDLLGELRQGRSVTCVLTTHLMDEADRCDRVLILDEGSLVASDTPEALKKCVGGDVITISSHRPGELAKRINEKFQVEADRIDGELRIERPDGYRFVPELVEAFPGEIDHVSVGKPTLSDAFFDLTGRRFGNEDEEL
ncbi:MAG: ABC transporter ATP-binding protein [Planctomycetota bacterium]